MDVNAPWPMVHHDRWNTAKAHLGPDSYDAPWIAATLTGGGISSAPPSLGSDGRGWISKWIDTKVYYFDYKNMTVLGAYTPPAPKFCTTTPAIYNAERAVGNDESGACKLFAINPNVMFHYWAQPISQPSTSDFNRAHPILGPDGDVVIGDGSGKLVRYDVMTGAKKWSTQMGGIGRSVCFSRDDQFVFVSNDRFISMVNYASGAVVWSRDLGKRPGTPSVLPNGNVVCGNETGIIYCLDPTQQGLILWSMQTFGAVNDACAIDGNFIYATSEDQYLYKINAATGQPVWGFVSSGAFKNGPIISHDGSRVYVVNRFGVVNCVDGSTGAKVWQIELGNEVRGSASLSPDGVLFVPCTSEGVYAISQKAPLFKGNINVGLVSGSYRYPITATLTLNDYGTSTARKTTTVALSETGNFEWKIDVPLFKSGNGANGRFDIVLKVPGFLKMRAKVNLSDQEPDRLDRIAVPGDIDQNNTINTDDYLRFNEVFDTSLGEPLFNPLADLNGDGYIGTDDYLIFNDTIGTNGE
jgi:outer membrane protein assembly factor BamB